LDLRRVLAVIIVAAAAAVLIAGLALADLRVIWQKAAYVCLECIGVG